MKVCAASRIYIHKRGLYILDPAAPSWAVFHLGHRTSADDGRLTHSLLVCRFIEFRKLKSSVFCLCSGQNRCQESTNSSQHVFKDMLCLVSGFKMLKQEEFCSSTTAAESMRGCRSRFDWWVFWQVTDWKLMHWNDDYSVTRLEDWIIIATENKSNTLGSSLIWIYYLENVHLNTLEVGTRDYKISRFVLKSTLHMPHLS